MFQQLILLLGVGALTLAQVRIPNGNEPFVYKLCVSTDQAFEKCQQTFGAAKDNYNSIELPLECVKESSVDSCIQSVSKRASDLVLLTGHDYKPARQKRLRPILFERSSLDSAFIAVAPRNITWIDFNSAPLDVDLKDHSAFHAAALFNLQRGHDVCFNLKHTPNTPNVSIKIIDSAKYQPTTDEILICPDHGYAEYTDFPLCNFQAELQRAVFASQHAPRKVTSKVKSIFETILQHFDPNSTNFNSFYNYQGNDNVVYKNNVVAFDLHPTYLNNVNEEVFDSLHCNEDHSHDHA